MNRFYSALALAAASLALATPAFAAKLKVPGQYPTIQDAINAAGPDDVIRISAGTYHEAIVIAGNSGLRIEAKGKVVLDGSGGPTAVTVVAANDVHLKGLKIRNADLGVGSLGTTGLRIEDCLIEQMTDRGVFIDLGMGCSLESSRIRHIGDDAVVIEDSVGCSVIDSKFSHVDGNGVLVNGVQHSIVGNRFEKVFQKAIRAGLGASTSGLLIADNRVRQDQNGAIYATTSVDLSILSNDFRGGSGSAIYTAADTSFVLIDDNRFKKINGSAILFRSQNSTVSRNQTRQCGNGLVPQAASTGCLFQENVLKKSTAYGIYNQAAGNVFLGNVASKSADLDLNDVEDPTQNAWIGNSIGTSN